MPKIKNKPSAVRKRPTTRFHITVPIDVNDRLRQIAKDESAQSAIKHSKQDVILRVLEKFAKGEVEIRGGLFLLL